MPLPRGTTIYNKRPFAGDFERLVEYLPRELNIIDRAIKDTRIASRSTVTGDVTLGLDDFAAFVDASGGPVTVTLPEAAQADGRTYNVKKVDATANAVTVASAANIDGAATVILSLQHETVTLFSDGTTYWIL